MRRKIVLATGCLFVLGTGAVTGTAHATALPPNFCSVVAAGTPLAVSYPAGGTAYSCPFDSSGAGSTVAWTAASTGWAIYEFGCGGSGAPIASSATDPPAGQKVVTDDCHTFTAFVAQLGGSIAVIAT